MDAGKRPPHFLSQNPMRWKGQCRRHKNPVFQPVSIMARPWGQQQQVLRHHPRCPFQRMQHLCQLGSRSLLQAKLILNHPQGFGACRIPLPVRKDVTVTAVQ